MIAPLPPAVVRCRLCGRELAASASRAAGIGPDCEAKSHQLAAGPASRATGGVAFLHEPGAAVVLVRLADGTPATNVIAREVLRHAAVFDWGAAANGIGRAHLAYNVLIAYMHRDEAYWRLASFERAFLAELPAAGGRIEREAILAWLEGDRREAPMPRYCRAPAARDDHGKKRRRPARRPAAGRQP